MKPPQFSAWMFAQLGALPGDELVDLFPGSGAVTDAWQRYTLAGARDPSRDPRPGSTPRHVAQDLDERGQLALVLALGADQPAAGPSDTSPGQSTHAAILDGPRTLSEWLSPASTSTYGRVPQRSSRWSA